jgi:benzoate transport
MAADVRKLIDDGRLTGVQLGVFLICLIMNMLDGMDVMVISYSSSALSADWGISGPELGVVFSAALFGMSLGALFLGPVADVIGRRAMVMISILVMGLGVFITAHTTNIEELIALRFISGLGIGAMLASTATLASEYAPNRVKNLVVSIVLSGYPIGATLSGLVASHVIPEYGWRTMFHVAGLISLATLPFAWFFMSESLDWLTKKQPKAALGKLNSILDRMGHDHMELLPPLPEEARKNPLSTLFKSGRTMMTIQLWVAFFLAFATLYYLTAWIPKLAGGGSPAGTLGIYAGTAFNLGAVFGIWTQGWLSLKMGLRRSVILFFILTAVLMIAFDFFQGEAIILLVFGLIGYGVQGGFIGMYSMAARAYPTEMRSAGIGGAIGAGRIGAVASPILAGYLVGWGWSITAQFLFFSVPILIVCWSIWRLSSKDID